MTRIFYLFALLLCAIPLRADPISYPTYYSATFSSWPLDLITATATFTGPDGFTINMDDDYYAWNFTSTGPISPSDDYSFFAEFAANEVIYLSLNDTTTGDLSGGGWSGGPPPLEYGFYSGGTVAFTPLVPEPGTFALVAMGIFAIFCLRRLFRGARPILRAAKGESASDRFW
jgi:hypothetical protein